MLKTDKDANIPTKKIKSLYELYQLTQMIDEATRVTMTTSSLIGHIVTNTPEKISDSGVIHTGISDHSLVFAIRKISVIDKQENILEIRNMKNFHTCPIPLQDVQWTFECPLDISVRPLDEWTFECPLDISVCPLDISVCPMDEWTFECRMDISVRPLVE